jgi:hypothetical protein
MTHDMQLFVGISSLPLLLFREASRNRRMSFAAPWRRLLRQGETHLVSRAQFIRLQVVLQERQQQLKNCISFALPWMRELLRCS